MGKVAPHHLVDVGSPLGGCAHCGRHLTQCVLGAAVEAHSLVPRGHVDGAMRTMLTFILDLLTAHLIGIIVEEDVPSHVAMHFTTLGIGLIVTICA